jgi:ankyrin repeat protein
MGSLPTVKMLVKIGGACLLIKNNNGMTALDIATAAGHTTIVEYLTGG